MNNYISDLNMTVYAMVLGNYSHQPVSPRSCSSLRRFLRPFFDLEDVALELRGQSFRVATCKLLFRRSKQVNNINISLASCQNTQSYQALITGVDMYPKWLLDIASLVSVNAVLYLFNTNFQKWLRCIIANDGMAIVVYNTCIILSFYGMYVGILRKETCFFNFTFKFLVFAHFMDLNIMGLRVQPSFLTFQLFSRELNIHI